MDLVVHARESFANEGYSGVYGVDEFGEFMKDAVCGILMALRTLRGWILALKTQSSPTTCLVTC
jgi:hypothetical protein